MNIVRHALNIIAILLIVATSCESPIGRLVTIVFTIFNF